MYSLDDYHYHLPEALIAQQPAQRRDGSRLLHLHRETGRVSHRRFQEIIDLLRPSDVMVINNTRVIPARLHGRKASGGKIELLILDYAETTTWGGNERKRLHRCLIKASKPASIGTRLFFDEGLVAIIRHFSRGMYTVEFSAPESFENLLNRIGKMPLPPYIKRDAALPDEADRGRYQTVYAREQGAIAAPTAGLHFSEAVLSKIGEYGVTVAPVTLHVGYSTFEPVRVDDIREHRMHAEWFSIPAQTARTVTQAKADGRRIVAVGTTSVRTLEYAARADGSLAAGHGRCDLFIYPGYRFSIVDAMLTNFHLPRSTLLMLVSAFASRETMLGAYDVAVKEKYRFFSYGDAMFID